MSLFTGFAGGKWLGFVSAIWVQAICGNNYTFANYSDVLKSLMALSQMQLNNLSVAKDVGKAFGVLSGLASDNWSTSVILMIGAIMGFIGYGVQWLVVSQRISPLPYWLMCIFMCMGGNSSTWMNTAVLVTCMRNFPQNRGPISGILKGYVGLSTAIFTDICTAMFSSDPSMFLLMLTIVPAVICIIAALFLHESPPASTYAEENQETQFFNIFNLIAVAVAVYLLAFDISGPHGHVLSLVFTAGLLILLAMPLLVPLYLVIFKPRSNLDKEKQIHEPLLAQKNLAEKEERQDNEVSAGTKVEEVEIKQKPMIGEEHTIIEMVKTIDFWVLFVSFLFGVGTGLCVMNNMGQMGLALGYSDVSIFISFISIWGFFGRIISGSLSEYYIRKSAIPRLVWNAASQILMALGYIAMAMALPGSLYIGSMLVGICYGVRFTITPAAASELFGLKYYGLLYNILILNLPIGSFIFSGLIAGYLYDVEATSVPGGGNTCIGAHCYMLVYVIMAFACVLGCALDLLLTIRTKNVYSKIHLERSLVNSIVRPCSTQR
ncbi:protein NUCLEAR FUSION DEFECTIVE 4-like [Gastrolobium bilobum]|uniref:protein NUCLEAR FUSION DEFECTIVE 4-like n=1 Tax=Gastrolobium bilobum TaxID=150636 RepID=UPI002AB23C5F|nr:protein NUCLEAR FUSION DEFECTIVE 4-like [Gastrolobium bilobum]